MDTQSSDFERKADLLLGQKKVLELIETVYNYDVYLYKKCKNNEGQMAYINYLQSIRTVVDKYLYSNTLAISVYKVTRHNQVF